MFAVEVRDHIMIAHSLAGAVFGPAQRLHGATYVVDMTFFREALDENRIVVDIGLALDALKRVLQPLAYNNLDQMEPFKGRDSTTEVLAKYIFDAMAAEIRAGKLGEAAKGIDSLKVTLNESHVAKAWYQGKVGA
ncbi:MAG: 6-carboxytetrahydropterin synthase [Rhodospirillales bacterium]|nr:6-carboxytetrahydropterin synthase [Rhodospirillales bacterium]